MTLRDTIRLWWYRHALKRPMQLELPEWRIRHVCDFQVDPVLTRLMNEPYQPYMRCTGCPATFAPPNR